MTKIKPGLGRGLDALINPDFQNDKDSNFTVKSDKIQNDDGKSYDILVKLPINSITPNPYQPRKEFVKEALDDLKKSILENGLIQPITVRRRDKSNYELISGERRLRACREIGLIEIPAYIIKVETKEAMLALSLIENIQREELNPIEVAVAYKRLLEECKLSHEEIAQKVGKNRSTVTNSIRLLKLPGKVQDSIVKGEISSGHARCLINVPSEKTQLDLLSKIVKEGLSVRKLEAAVKKLTESKTKTLVAASNSKKDEVFKNDIENKLRTILGTKVICKQKKNGSGEFVIEYYSNDELDRLFELFEIIEKYNY